MKKLDKYIFKKYITTFLFVVLIFTMIAVIIDFSEKVENFVEEDCTISEITIDYYLGFIPYINSLLLPLYALISVIFFTSRMANNSEIISILNAGVSFNRLLVPYMSAALLIVCFHLVANHFIVPIGNKSRLDFEHTYIWKHSDKGKTNKVHMFLGDNKKVFIRYFNKKEKVGHDFRIESFSPEGKLISYLEAKECRWQNDKENWRLKNYQIRSFNGMRETFLHNRNETIDTTLNLIPEDFVRFTNQKEMMDSPALLKFIEAEKNRGLSNTKLFEIEYHRRTSDPITIFILTLIGVAVAARKVRGGMGMHLAIGIAVGAIYIFLSKFSVTFASNSNFPTILGVWIPNIIFGTIGLFLAARAQK